MGQMKVGYLCGMVIDRDFEPKWDFWELCDSESQELHQLSATFCDTEGKVSYKDIDGLDRKAGRNASRGGFLYIQMISIEKKHRRHDVGINCLKRTLGFLNTLSEFEEYGDLSANWTFAALEAGLQNTNGRS